MTVTRGTSNSNARGSSAERRRRRVWLVQTYRANVDASVARSSDGSCRCYRCGVLLIVETVTVDRIIPGCQGGTYRRTNIRPGLRWLQLRDRRGPRRRP